MNDYHDISFLYQSFCSVPAEQHWYILTIHSKPEEYKKLKRILFPPRICEDEIKYREALLYLYLWNLLFYNKYPYNEDYLWKNSEHKRLIVSSLYKLMESNPSQEINKIFSDICANWQEINQEYDAFKSTQLFAFNSTTQKNVEGAYIHRESELSPKVDAIIRKEKEDKINFPNSIVVEVEGLKIKFGPSKSGWGVDFTNKSNINDWFAKRIVFPILHKVQENSKYTFSVTLYSLPMENIEYNIKQAFSIACNKIESECENKEKVCGNYSSEPKQTTSTHRDTLELIEAVQKKIISSVVQNLQNIEQRKKSVTDYSLFRNREGQLWKVGDLYDTGDKKGIVFWVNAIGTHGKIVSLDQAYMQWCTPVAQKKWKFLKGSSIEDGIKNTHQVLEGVLKDQYPAFLWCKTHGPDWYLPSLNEMKEIHNDCVINALKVHGIHTPSLKNHWTSTEINSRFAYMISKANGQEKSAKEASALVRAVCEF